MQLAGIQLAIELSYAVGMFTNRRQLWLGVQPNLWGNHPIAIANQIRHLKM
jgi:hypothetical protein